MFTNYDEDNPTNNIIDINDPSFVKGTLYANLNADVATIGGTDIKVFAENAFDAANTNATAITALQGVDLTQNTNITKKKNPYQHYIHYIPALHTNTTYKNPPYLRSHPLSMAKWVGSACALKPPPASQEGKANLSKSPYHPPRACSHWTHEGASCLAE